MEISAIILKFIELANAKFPNLKIEIIGNNMIRSNNSEFLSNGQLGVNVKIKSEFPQFEETIFLGYQFCEDALFMHTNLLVEEFIMSILIKHKDKFAGIMNGTYKLDNQ